MAGGGEFRVGWVLAQAVRIYLRNLPAYWVLGLLAVLPVVIHILGVPPSEDAQASVDRVSMACNLLLGNLVTAAVVFGVVNQLGGHRPSFLRCIGAGLRFALPVLFLGIAVGLCVGIGLLLFVVPGVVLAVRWYVAIPAAVVERRGIGQALARSTDLTGGRRWQVFALAMAQFAVYFLLVFALYAWILPERQLTWSEWRLEASLTEVGSSFFATFFSVTAAVAYHALRVEKEGVSIEDLMKVFD